MRKHEKFFKSKKYGDVNFSFLINKNMKNAIFPGSFDPFTLGHLDIVKKSEKIFDKIIIGIGENDSKKPLLSVEKRKKK